MNNKRATKRALLTSIMALVMCVVMLVGTTFAWFTDTASTGVNKIQAGNLKMEVTYKNTADGGFEKVDKETSVFNNNALWEPGHVEFAVLNVKNTGSLALKYKLGINIVSETGSTNVNGDTFNLSDYIKFAVIEGDATENGIERAALVAAAENAGSKLINEGYSKENNLNETNDADTVTLVVWMPETVGNKANHKTDVAAPSIDLGISVAATQYTYENDSFNNEYDKGAVYPIVAMDTLQELINNAAEPVSAKLEGNIAGSLTVPQDKNITLDLNGFTLTGGDTHAILNRGTLCIKDSSGNGKIVASKANTSALRNGDNAVCVVEGGTISRDGANGNTWHVVENFGKMTFNGGKVVLKNGNGFAITNGWNYFDPGASTTHAVMEINALELDTDSSGIKNCRYGDLTVNDVTVTSTGYWALSNDYLGTAVINGGTLTSNSFKAVSNGAAMTVNGGTFNGTEGLFVQNYATSTVLNGGTFANMNVGALSGYVGTGHTAQQSGTSVIIK